MKTVAYFVLLLLAASVAFLAGDMLGVAWLLGDRGILVLAVILMTLVLFVIWFGLRMGIRKLDGHALRRALTGVLVVAALAWGLFALTLLLAEQLPPRSDGSPSLSVDEARITQFGLMALATVWLMFFQARQRARDAGTETQRETLEAFE